MTTFFTSRLIRQRRKRPRPWIAGSRRLVHKTITADVPLSAYQVVAGATPVLLTYRRNIVVTSPGTQYGPVTPGVTVILQKAKFLPAAAASPGYVLVGSDATLREDTLLVNKTLDATVPASYALVAPATPVQLLRSRKVDATTLAVYGPVTPGVTVNLKHGWKVVVAAPAASYLLVKEDATLTKVVGKKVDAASGVYGPLVGAATPIQLRKTWRLDVSIPVTYTVVQAAQPAAPLLKRKLNATTPVSYALVAPATPVLLLRQRRIDALAKTPAYALTGTDATLRKGKSVIATPAGVYGPLVGQAASLRINMPLIAGTPVSPYALVAPATPVLLTYRRKVIPTPAGVYSYTGVDVALTRPTEKVMAAGVANYLLVGTNTPILVKRKLDATTTPQYLLTGTDQTLRYRRTVSALAAGVYGPLAGAATTNTLLKRKLDALPKTPAYLLTGTDQTLTYRRKVIPTPAGVYGPLAGQAASLRINMPLVAGVLAPPYTLVPAATPAVLRINMPLAAAPLSPPYALIPGVSPAVLLRQRRLVADTIGGVGDPSFSSVKLLLGFEGVDGSTGAPGMTDESPSARGNATVSGNAEIDNGDWRFGSTCLIMDGVGDKISFPDSADWQFDGQFTIECWYRPTALPTLAVLMAHGASSISYGWFLNSNNAGDLTFRMDDNGDGASVFSISAGAPTMVVSTWYHIAVDRDATNKVRLYIDGAMRNSVTSSITSFNAAAPLDIGMIGSSFALNGRLDEVRITKGVARYASDAGYTVPTAAFPRSGGGAGTTYALTPGATVNLTKLANNVIAATPASYLLTPATTTNLRRNLPLIAGAKTPGYLLTGQAALTARLRMTNAGPSPPYLLVGSATTNVLVKLKIAATVSSYALLAGDTVTVTKGGAQPLEPLLYNDPDTFFAHSLSIIQSINPELFEDPDRFFTHTIEFDQFIEPNLFMDPDSFFGGVVFVFYGDTEVIDVPYEDRCMVLEHEDREMITLPEDRDMEVLDEETDMYVSPRKRRA